MTLGALLDLGVGVEVVQQALDALDIPGLAVSVERVHRGGIAALQVHGPEEGPGEPARTWQQIRAQLEGSGLPEPVRELALDTFSRLASAEAGVHGVPVEQVHFHEVGGLDALADIVGVAAVMAHLAPQSVSASPLPLGEGSVQTRHGELPVPAPATVALLEGIPVVPGPAGGGELVTPTGAALLRTYVKRFGQPPAMTLGYPGREPGRGELRGQGFGAGSRQVPGRPNVLRVLAGTPAEPRTVGPRSMTEISAEASPEISPEISSESAAQASAGMAAGTVTSPERVARAPEDAADWVEGAANLDDMSPELGPWVIDRLLEAGASDAWLEPVVMKKGRAAVKIGFLCRRRNTETVTEALLRESTSLGVRYHGVRRAELSRRQVTVQTRLGPIRVKVGGDPAAPDNLAPEFEDCRRVAEQTGTPLKQVYRLALEAYRGADTENP
jgi:hypothetical protein